MTADPQSNPYIVTYWRSQDSDVPQYRLVWNKDGRWQQTQVGNRTQAFSLSGGGTKMIPVARPRVVADGDYIAMVFRDAERGSKVSVASTHSGPAGPWTVSDLTTFGVDAWEPSLDTSLWNSGGDLHVFVQQSSQGDGERVVDVPPTTVYVLEIPR